MNPIKILVADDHKLFRECLICLLNDHPEFEVVATAKNGFDLLSKIPGQNPDLILLDLNMPRMNGFEAAEQLKIRYPQIKIIALSMMDDDKHILKLFKMGINGFLSKNSDPEVIMEAMSTIMKDGFYLDNISHLLHQAFVTRYPTNQTCLNLSDREVSVLKLVCHEYSTPEISEKLCLSARTVEGYRQNLLVKTGSRNTAGLVKFACEHNYV